MRGKATLLHRIAAGKGITPAYAGKRKAEKECSYPRWDHPRLCGEKASRTLGQALRAGSPPPMRGKGAEFVGGMERLQDHPRLCGEKTKKIPKQRYFFHQPASFSFSLQYT